MRPEKQPYEMTVSQFTNKFYQHGNIRAQTPEEAAETRKKIEEEGFKSEYTNVIPVVGKVPGNVIEMKYATRVGIDYYVVPEDMVEFRGNGSRIRNGWKPTSDQIIQVRYNGQPLHEALIERALSEGKLNPDSKTGRRVLADYPDLQKQYAKSLSPMALATSLSASNKQQIS